MKHQKQNNNKLKKQKSQQDNLCQNNMSLKSINTVVGATVGGMCENFHACR